MHIFVPFLMRERIVAVSIQPIFSCGTMDEGKDWNLPREQESTPSESGSSMLDFIMEY
jgi:hypothetical protein